MYKISLLLLLITKFSYSSFPIEERHIQKPRHLPDAELVFKNKAFYVIRNGLEIPIKQYDTGKELRAISKKQLKAFLKSGYLCLKQFNNGDYALYANTRGVGGCIGTYLSVAEGTATAAQVGGTLIWWLP